MRPLPRPPSPPPSPEQIANGLKWGYDPCDVIGLSKWWAMPESRLNPAAVIHDEMYLYKLTPSERWYVDFHFHEDCEVLAEADESGIEKIEAAAFKAIVYAVSPFIDTSIDRNTDVTRAQGIERMNVAKRQINAACRVVATVLHYPDVEEERHEPPY